LCFNIRGRAIRLIITTLAPTIPVLAARIAPTTTTDIASPPLGGHKEFPHRKELNLQAFWDFSKIKPI